MRRPLILLSVVILAVALLVANVAWWMDSEVLDNDAFVESAVVALNQPTSRDAIATIVVDRLVEEVQVLVVVDDLLVSVFSRLLGTPELQDVLVLVSQDLHQRMVSGETGPIIIDLEPYREVLLGPVEAISPELASRVPGSWFRAVEVLEGGVIPDLSAIAEKGRTAAIAAAAVAVALIVLIVVVAERWWVRLGAIGTSFLVAGGLSAVAISAGVETVVAVNPGTPRAVLVANLSTELAASVTKRSLDLVVIGAVLVVAALVMLAIGVTSKRIAS